MDPLRKSALSLSGLLLNLAAKIKWSGGKRLSLGIRDKFAKACGRGDHILKELDWTNIYGFTGNSSHGKSLPPRLPHIRTCEKAGALWLCATLHHPTRAFCLRARSRFGALQLFLILGTAGGEMIFLEEAPALAAGVFAAALLRHFAPEASHTLSTFQPLLYARENTKSKMKEKHPKIDIIKCHWIRISLHKLTH